MSLEKGYVKTQEHRDTQGEHHMKKEAKTVVTQLQVRGHQGLPAITRRS